VPVIGEFLSAATTAVEKEGGTIDKFIGDSVMAFWGAPRDQEDHAFHACKAALEIQRTLGLLDRRDGSGQAIGVRIGINTGKAIVGNIGTRSRLNYTVLGDTVNLASRLEAANKVYRTSIILGEETASCVANRAVVRELDRVAVYGREEGTRIFELISLGQEAKPAWIKLYEAALSLYRRGECAEARTLFAQVVSERGEDWPSEVLLARCEEFERDPPPKTWSGVTRMQSK
jgi:adenylate cyclase